MTQIKPSLLVMCLGLGLAFFLPLLQVHAGLVLVPTDSDTGSLDPQLYAHATICETPPTFETRVDGRQELVWPATGCVGISYLKNDPDDIAEFEELYDQGGCFELTLAGLRPTASDPGVYESCYYVEAPAEPEELEPTPARGLVPCGGTGQPACQACHVIDLTNNVIGWFVIILGTIAAIIIVYAGAKLVTANGNQRAMEDAKSMMNNIIIGYVIVLAGWLLIGTVLKAVLNEGQYGVWNQVQCVDRPVAQNNPYVPRYTNPGQSLSFDTNWLPVTNPSGQNSGVVQSQCSAVGINSDGSLSYSCSDQAAQCANAGGVSTISSDGDVLTCSPAQYGAGSGCGSCEVVTDPNNACYPAKLTCFPDQNLASEICNSESRGGNTSIMSGTDLCQDGRSFSVGLWQINILVNHSLLPGCSSGFYTSDDGGRSQGSCVERRTNSNGVTYCQYRSCEITNIDMYNRCVLSAQNPTNNTNAACSLMRTQGWSAWQTSYNECR